MSFLNMNYQLVIYEQGSSRNPNVRQPDISKEIKEIPVNSEKTEKLVLYPGDIVTLATTSRSISWDGTTGLDLARPLATSDAIRLSWDGTGTNPAFRTKRAIGGAADTQVTITALSPYVKRISVVAGTSWNTTSVVAGDLIKFEKTTDSFTSPFSETNQSLTLQVQAKGANYIDFIDNGISSIEGPITLGADFDFALRVFTQGPVKIGDTLYISSSAVNPSNQGKFAITDVSPDYLEFVNPFAADESFLKDAGMVVYNYLIGFLMVRASDSLQIRFGGQTEWANLQKIGLEALLIGSVGTHEIEARNNGSQTVEVTVQTAQVV
jgi:hypothetical protein